VNTDKIKRDDFSFFNFLARFFFKSVIRVCYNIRTYVWAVIFVSLTFFLLVLVENQRVSRERESACVYDDPSSPVAHAI